METLAGRAELSKGRRSAPEVVTRYVDRWYRKNVRWESINRIARNIAAVVRSRGMRGSTSATG